MSSGEDDILLGPLGGPVRPEERPQRSVGQLVQRFLSGQTEGCAMIILAFASWAEGMT